MQNITETQAAYAVNLARIHADNPVDMHSSAKLCLSDAVTLFENGEYQYAMGWAYRSLLYSVGAFHHDCREIGVLFGGCQASEMCIINRNF